jgi:hypothetical protein
VRRDGLRDVERLGSGRDREDDGLPRLRGDGVERRLREGRERQATCREQPDSRRFGAEAVGVAARRPLEEAVRRQRRREA